MHSSFARALKKPPTYTAVISDRDTVIAVSGAGKRELSDKSVSLQLGKIMDERVPYRHFGMDGALPVCTDDDKFCISVAVPIIAEGDVSGCVLFVAARGSEECGEVEFRLAQSAAIFLGKQMES